LRQHEDGSILLQSRPANARPLPGRIRFPQRHLLVARQVCDKVAGGRRLSRGERLRDIKTGLDGALYILTDSPRGQVLRISAAR